MSHSNPLPPGFRIRPATESDAGTILRFIRLLAEYEKLSDAVTATEEKIRDSVFRQNRAEVLLAEYMDEPVGFALFFHNYSTFLGQAGIYLEDLFILPEMRGRGFGKSLLRQLAELAVDRGCGRLEWSCLDWNEPAIRFYQSLGAREQNEWTSFRISGDELRKLAGAETQAG
jgi:GNAT superfamily N-acetyltransferase